jgi:hypothetical protein
LSGERILATNEHEYSRMADTQDQDRDSCSFVAKMERLNTHIEIAISKLKRAQIPEMATAFGVRALHLNSSRVGTSFLSSKPSAAAMILCCNGASFGAPSG